MHHFCGAFKKPPTKSHATFPYTYIEGICDFLSLFCVNIQPPSGKFVLRIVSIFFRKFKFPARWPASQPAIFLSTRQQVPADDPCSCNFYFPNCYQPHGGAGPDIKGEFRRSCHETDKLVNAERYEHPCDRKGCYFNNHIYCHISQSN